MDGWVVRFRASGTCLFMKGVVARVNDKLRWIDPELSYASGVAVVGAHARHARHAGPAPRAALRSVFEFWPLRIFRAACRKLRWKTRS